MEVGEENKKKINPKELAEMQRLYIELTRLLAQAPKLNPKVQGLVFDVVEEARKNFTDYTLALEKKYNFNARKQGINRTTGEIQDLPEDVIKGK